MKLAIFNARPYDEAFFINCNNKIGLDLHFFEARMSLETYKLAEGFPAICVFVNDILDADVLQGLNEVGTKFIALRCAGYNNVDLTHAKELGIRVARVPAYSPESVAEYTIGLMLTLNRKIHRAYNRVKENNFDLDGFMGFDFHNRTVGVVGTGRIGFAVIRILHGIGCKILAYDIQPNPDCLALGVEYVELPELFKASDVITLHCPHTDENHHLINADSLKLMKDGVMIINTSRGGLIDTNAVVEGLKTRKVSNLGLDVYEYERPLLYQDHSNEVLLDDMFSRLLTFPNVIITGHQGFFTHDALESIAHITLENVHRFYTEEPPQNELF
ncbi:2-hydroxyacid dehydrogenase [Zooshikella sp. RANM57]|uniref:2-hydroxyacid dehydrogenase n=1 Tax=Zooshikella sp. RANM57 TaxID=3425863 RepID=UPI003D6EB5F9